MGGIQNKSFRAQICITLIACKVEMLSVIVAKMCPTANFQGKQHFEDVLGMDRNFAQHIPECSPME